jgi:sulfide:quinone oxidoreductase
VHAADRHHVLIAGGGVAALEAMLALHDLAPDLVQVTLLAPDDEFVYRPLSTGEAFGVTEVTSYPLQRLADEHGASLVKDAIVSVNAPARTVTTVEGREHGYDTLLVALGASRDAVFEDALTFVDQRNVPGFRELLDALRAGRVHSVAFLVPRGMVWPFPLYELALMTGELVREEGLDVKLSLVTSASRPLALFGPQAADAMAGMLAERGIEVLAGNVPARVVSPGRVLLEPDGYVLAADKLVALPRLTGPEIAGLPHTRDGFLPTDARGRVDGVDDVYAAGDCTNYPIKQGGLAAQQADLVVEGLVARLQGRPEPDPPIPMLRGVLLSGEGRSFLRRPEDIDDAEGLISGQALWWPPSKIAGRYLAPSLGFADERAQLERSAAGDGVEVEIPVSPAADHEDRLRDLERELG